MELQIARVNQHLILIVLLTCINRAFWPQYSIEDYSHTCNNAPFDMKQALRGYESRMGVLFMQTTTFRVHEVMPTSGNVLPSPWAGMTVIRLMFVANFFHCSVLSCLSERWSVMSSNPGNTASQSSVLRRIEALHEEVRMRRPVGVRIE